jgi:hypothetical protein
MGANAKKKTTMAKLDRERKMRESPGGPMRGPPRLDKQARKDARKLAAANPLGAPDDAEAAAPALADR